MTNDGPSSAMPDTYFKDFDSLWGTEMFEGLVHYLQKQGVSVVFLLPPFHAFAYRSCYENSKYAITLKVEEYIRHVARRDNITVIGSFNPSGYGFKGEDFYDGHHGHEIVMKRLFEGYKYPF